MSFDSVLISNDALTDLGAVTERIKKEIHRGKRSIDEDQIKMAICSAIQHYRGRRFHFNEGNYSFLSIKDQGEYGEESSVGSRDGYPKNLLRIDVLRIEHSTSSTWKHILDRVSISQLRDRQSYSSASADPDIWAWHARKLHLWPNPTEADLEIEIDYVKDIGTPYYQNIGGAFSFKEFSSSVSVTDSWNSFWFDYAEELIRARAEWDLYMNYLKNYDHAEAAKIVEMDALRSLEGDTDNYSYPGSAVAWSL